jgi:5S rRNA maturation endonuclease (ribonuclease M5)
VKEEFAVENLILLDLDESGRKIEKIFEFTDVAESKRYMGALQELLATKAE